MKGTETSERTARCCYGHLGGKLGNRLFARLIELGWFELEEDRATVYRITDKGREELARLGVSLDWTSSMGKRAKTDRIREEKPES